RSRSSTNDCSPNGAVFRSTGRQLINFSTRSVAELMRISIDCSFLAHALIRDQATPDAIAALREVASQHQAFGTPVLFLEFPSLLRRSVNQQKLTARSAAEIFEFF